VSARDRRLARRRSRTRDPGGPLFKPSRHALASQPDLDGLPVPNLLALEPRLTVDAGEVLGALDFAFAGGSSAELLEGVFDDPALPASDFEPDCFAEDLFVEELVETTMIVDIDGWRPALHTGFVADVLCRPPQDLDVVELRRDVLRELTGQPRLRRGFEQLYRSLSQLWRLLGEAASTSRYEATRRRIDALALIRRIVDHARTTFSSASSALQRIGAYADAVAETQDYAQVVEVLDYENDMARVDVRMQVGVDGRVRRFQILRLAESDDNRFYATPLGRWVGRVVMWWRGYKFTNDELVDRWLDQVFEGIGRYLPSLVMLSGHMEVFLASLSLRDRCEAAGLPMSFPELAPGATRSIQGLFNPLLFAQDVVPISCNVQGSDDACISVITGPNSGGKTRLLQALGLAQLLSQSGMYAPIASGTLPVATGMFVSVIAEHGATDREGRLGTELIRVRRLFEKARTGALVILDELCSGTNPSEGEEIFHLVLQLLAELGPEAFISTHFLSFVRRLEDDDDLPLSFLQVELDEHQRPTYGFVPGVATTSLAAQTAARLGVTREELMALVRRNMPKKRGKT
jgi:DNA mismatch repair protein MutS2